MEIEQNTHQLSIFQGIIQQCDSQLQMNFIEFLQTQTLFTIALLAKKYQRQEQFFKICLVTAYFRNYLIKVDRSMYYLFYDEIQFKNLQKAFIMNFAKSSANQFFQFKKQYQTNFQQFFQASKFVQQPEELKKILQNIYFQTDYPLPACKRQTVGIGCQTPFQQFMCLIRFPIIQPFQQYVEPPLIEMRNYFEEEINFKKTLQLIYQNGPINLDRMSIVRYCPFKLRNMDWKQIKIQGFPLHNLIVSLFKLIYINAKSSRTIIKQQNDPIMRIAEFVTRANLYKNLILSVQDKFSFLFKCYEEIYQSAMKNQNSGYLPKYGFWNGAMMIWIEEFQQIQNQLFDSFNYIVLKQRQKNIINFLEEKSECFPSVYNSLKSETQNNSLFDKNKEKIYQSVGQLYQQFFQKNIDSYQILGKDYLEHQIDISINQFNVHKIGHSQHVIKRIPFFSEFIQKTKQKSKQFYGHLQKLVYKVIPDKQMRLGTLKDMIKADFQFINGKFTRPVILKQIVTMAQNFMKSLIQTVPQYNVFTQEVLQKFGLHFDFSHKDNLLDYFAVQSSTPDDCSQDLRCFFDVYKDKSVQEILSIVNQLKFDQQNSDSQVSEQFYGSNISNNSLMSMQDF